jgi:uncharacterized protein (TIGR00730 family)
MSKRGSPDKQPAGKKEKLPPEKKLVKAYHNHSFLNSADARAIRILAEYLEPLHRLRKQGIKDTVVFYGSARMVSQEEADSEHAEISAEIEAAPEPSAEQLRRLNVARRRVRSAKYYDETRELARRLTEWSCSLDENQRFIVVSGGGPGIMEAANRGAHDAGGPTIGMNISLPFEQYPNRYISQDHSFEFHYFFMRKFWFLFPAKAIVICPGGFGTMDEMFDMLTLRQTLKIRKPMCIILYGKEYWRDIINFDKMVEWGVISEEDLDLFHYLDNVDEAYETLVSHLTDKFVGRKKYWSW